MQSTSSSTSRIRRKPDFTYKSPEPGDLLFFTLTFPNTSNHSNIQLQSPPKPVASSSRLPALNGTRSSRRYRGPPSGELSLYHPLGRLAMSLPPLDPASFGLPVLPVPDTLNQKRAEGSRHSSTKPHEVEEPPMPSPIVSNTPATSAREVKEKASPRKRRNGTIKRKRKELDDGDATYPAKRTRLPRNAPFQAVDEESTAETGPIEDPVTASEAPPTLVENSKRRSGRSRIGGRRRNSSASESPSTSPPTQTAKNPQFNDTAIPSSIPANGIDEPSTKSNGVQPSAGDDDKEDGEISEEHPNP